MAKCMTFLSGMIGLTLLNFVNSVELRCDAGWSLGGGDCYKLIEGKYSFLTASEKCSEFDGKLASAESDMQLFWLQALVDASGTSGWTGAERNESTKALFWQFDQSSIIDRLYMFKFSDCHLRIRPGNKAKTTKCDKAAGKSAAICQKKATNDTKTVTGDTGSFEILSDVILTSASKLMTTAEMKVTPVTHATADATTADATTADATTADATTADATTADATTADATTADATTADATTADATTADATTADATTADATTVDATTADATTADATTADATTADATTVDVATADATTVDVATEGATTRDVPIVNSSTAGMAVSYLMLVDKTAIDAITSHPTIMQTRSEGKTQSNTRITLKYAASLRTVTANEMDTSLKSSAPSKHAPHMDNKMVKRTGGYITSTQSKSVKQVLNPEKQFANTRHASPIVSADEGKKGVYTSSAPLVGYVIGGMMAVVVVGSAALFTLKRIHSAVKRTTVVPAISLKGLEEQSDKTTLV